MMVVKCAFYTGSYGHRYVYILLLSSFPVPGVPSCLRHNLLPGRICSFDVSHVFLISVSLRRRGAQIESMPREERTTCKIRLRIITLHGQL